MFKIIGNKRNDRNPGKKRGQARAEEKLAKKILGKDTGRRVFGFACSPNIHAQMKMLAGELQVPIFALAEHLLQLSVGLVGKAKENAEERDLLRRHLIEYHIDERTTEKFNWYDEELAKELNEDRLRRFAIEAAVRRIVVDYARKGMKPENIAWYTDYGYRCSLAFVNKRPVPPPRVGFSRKSQPSASRPAEEKEE